MLAEDPDGELPAGLEQREASAQAAAQARAGAQAAEQPDSTWVEAEETGETPPVLTLGELENVLAQMDSLAEAVREGNLHPTMAGINADDVLQGACVVLGLNFAGDVQLLVLEALKTYREIKGLR